MNREQISESGKIFSKILLLPLSAKVAIVIVFFSLTLAIIVTGRQVVIHNIFPAFVIDQGKGGVLKQSVKLPGQSDSAGENESFFLKGDAVKKAPLLLDNSAIMKVRVDQTPFFGDEHDLDPYGNY